MALKLCVNPAAPIPAPATLAADRRAGAAGIRLGILDNSKSNADHLLQFLADGAGEDVKIGTVVKHRKYSASRPADAAVLDNLAQETDFVLSAMAD